MFLTLSAANERQVAATSVTLTPPAGLPLGTVSREPAGWTVERGGGAVTWSGGPVAAGTFEEWGIELEAPDQPGSFTFRSTMRFADGRTDTHDVVLVVTAAGATPAHHGAGSSGDDDHGAGRDADERDAERAGDRVRHP